MTQFDVGLVHRLADQMESLALHIKKNVNSPDQLSENIKQMTSLLNSFQTLSNASESSRAYPILEDDAQR